MQLVPPPQTLPQVPQSLPSDPRSTQARLHAASPAPQLGWHAPEEHTSSEAQVAWHAPQCEGSSVRSTQSPSQKVCPPGHAQLRLAHDAPPVHVTPHAPQSALLDARSTHAALQSARPVAHEPVQAPTEQTWPAAQALPQAPQ